MSKPLFPKLNLSSVKLEDSVDKLQLSTNRPKQVGSARTPGPVMVSKNMDFHANGSVTGRKRNTNSSVSPGIFQNTGDFVVPTTGVGEIETWPAVHNTQVVSKAPSSNTMSNLAKKVFEDFQIVSSTKPKFLSRIEAYMESELNRLKLEYPNDTSDNTVIYNTARFQIMRESFQLFSDEFTTYKDFISLIKREYDNRIDQYEDKLLTFEGLRTRVSTHAQESMQSMQVLKTNYESIIQGHLKEIESLKKELAQVKEKHSVISSDLISKSQEIAKLNQLTTEQFDSNRSLSMALKRYAESNVKDVQKELNDAALYLSVKNRYEKQTEDLAALKKEFEIFSADHKDCCSKFEYNKVKDMLDVVSAKLKSSFHHGRRESLKELIPSRSPSVMNDVSQVDPSLTNKLVIKTSDAPENHEAEVQPIFVSQKKVLSESDGRNVEIVVGVLSQELDLNLCELNYIRDKIVEERLNQEYLAEMKSSYSKDDTLVECLGMASNVPKFLAFNGRIRARKFSMKDTLNLVRTIFPQTLNQKGNLSDLLYQYFRKEFVLQKFIVEQSYGFVKALSEFSSNPEILLFRKILNGELFEWVYEAVEEHIGGLLILFNSADKRFSGSTEGISNLTREQFVTTMYAFFPQRSLETMEVLKKQLYREISSVYKREFLSKIYEQFVGELSEFLTDIRTGLLKKDVYKTGSITFADIRDTIFEVDPEKTRDEINKLLLNVLEISSIDAVTESNVFIVEDIMIRMKACSKIRRTGLRPYNLFVTEEDVDAETEKSKSSKEFEYNSLAEDQLVLLVKEEIASDSARNAQNLLKPIDQIAPLSSKTGKLAPIKIEVNSSFNAKIPNTPTSVRNRRGSMSDPSRRKSILNSTEAGDVEYVPWPTDNANKSVGKLAPPSPSAFPSVPEANLDSVTEISLLNSVSYFSNHGALTPAIEDNNEIAKNNNETILK